MPNEPVDNSVYDEIVARRSVVLDSLKAVMTVPFDSFESSEDIANFLRSALTL